ncbi:TetR/AcrR family transcriptional regulator [Rhodopila sp.]|uniref:TetR/AcrR family transcriptional regulator n=1 Tax=Rhodopila sp. TaxID=2480087 RepID=UPI003D0F3F26
MATEIHDGVKRGRGRPQGFDRETALQQAMTLFWERGYEGTTFDELIAAMGISPSSFYNSFGSKERLYQAAIDHYITCASCWFGRVLSEATTTRTAFERLLDAAAAEFTRDDRPAGCMISLEGTHLPPALASVRGRLMAHRAMSEQALAERLRRGVMSGDLPADTDVEVLAAFFSALFRGIAVQARDGASRERLMAIGRVAMRAWPCGSRRLRGRDETPA